MYARSLLPAVAALALAAAAPLHAQRTAVSPASPAPRLALHASPSGAPRALAVYRLSAPQHAGLPSEVTVADSAGDVVASYQLADGRTVGPLVVGVIDSGLVLQGETAAGLLTLVLYPADAAPVTGARRVVGQWALGDRQGHLHAARPRS